MDYRLELFTPGVPSPLVEELRRGAEVLARIQELLTEHPGCERIDVYGAGAKLFAVDCHGNRLP